jgi:excisionase family DNA binding protein
MMSAPSQSNVAMLSLQEAADRLGVHYMTAYRYVRLGQLPAEQRAGRWWVLAADVERMATRAPADRGRAPRVQRWSTTEQRLLARMLAGDGAACWSIIEQALARGAAATDVYLQLLAPVMRRVGDQWARGSISIGQEHRASSIALRISGRLGAHFSHRGRAVAGTVLIGGAPGDPHQLPLAMVVDVLRHQGVKVLDLGANVPADSFFEAASAVPDLRAVGISLSHDGASEATAEVIAGLHHDATDLFVVAGGPALKRRAAARDLGANAWAADALGAAELLGGPRP